MKKTHSTQNSSVLKQYAALPMSLLPVKQRSKCFSKFLNLTKQPVFASQLNVYHNKSQEQHNKKTSTRVRYRHFAENQKSQQVGPIMRIPFYKEVQVKQIANQFDFETIQKQSDSPGSSRSELLAQQPAEIFEMDQQLSCQARTKSIVSKSAIIDLECTFNPSKLRKELLLAREDKDNLLQGNREVEPSKLAKKRQKVSKDLRIEPKLLEQPAVLKNKEGKTIHRRSERQIPNLSAGLSKGLMNAKTASATQTSKQASLLVRLQQNRQPNLENKRLSICETEYEKALQELRFRLVKFSLRQE